MISSYRYRCYVGQETNLVSSQPVDVSRIIEDIMKILNTKAEFEAAIAGSPGQLIVIDFFATWCPPCNEIAPFFQKLSKKYTEVVFYKIDTDVNEETTAMCNVEAMPTFQFYKNGEKLYEIVGNRERDLEAKIVDNQY